MPDVSEHRHVTLAVDDSFANICFDVQDSPVNILSSAVIDELEACLDTLANNSGIRGLFITSGKPSHFIAGANIEEIAKIDDYNTAKNAVQRGQTVIDRISQCYFPSVAVISGVCLGGGLELALACTYRVAANERHVKIGLPEVKLGIVPGFGGTQRLPKLVGFANGLELILSGRALNPQQAKRLQLVDDVASEAKLMAAAKRLIEEKRQRHSTLPWPMRMVEALPIGRNFIAGKARQKVEKTAPQYPAPLAAIQVISDSFPKKIKDGLEIEAQACAKLLCSDISKRLVHVYYLSELPKKISKQLPAPHTKTLYKAATLGAGTMGAGIAHLLATRDIRVRLIDLSTDSLAAALNSSWQELIRGVKRRRWDRVYAKECYQRILPSSTMTGVGNVDLVIEAITEELAIKQKVLQDLESRLKPDCMIATNTSSLSVSEIAKSLQKPEHFVGMHFFNPVGKMPLIEVIPGKQTATAVTSAVYKLCLKLKKYPVIVADTPGFLVNRLLGFYLREAMRLFEEGHNIIAIDDALVKFGMPMGPFSLMDQVGIDILKHAEKNLSAGFSRYETSALIGKLVGMGCLGKKTSKGFYLYEKNKAPVVNPQVAQLNRDKSITMRNDKIPLWKPPVFAMLGEACHALADKVVSHAAILDMAMIMGTGFPPFRGGLLKYAASMTPQKLRDSFVELQQERGKRFMPHENLDYYLDQATQVDQAMASGLDT